MCIFVIIITYNRITTNVTSCENYVTHRVFWLGCIPNLTDYIAKLDMEKLVFWGLTLLVDMVLVWTFRLHMQGQDNTRLYKYW